MAVGRPRARSATVVAIVVGVVLLLLGGSGLLAPSRSAPPRAPVRVAIGTGEVAPQLPPAPSVGRALPSYQWTTAYILYGPTDPTGLLFGEGSVMAADNPIQNTTTFGGLALDGLSNITLVYNNGTTGYWWYASSPRAPTARANSSFASYQPGGFAVLFGGLVNVRRGQTTNDTWLYGFANETWFNVTRGPAPPARENAAFAVDSKDGIALLEGGINPDYSTSTSTGSVLWNDTWQLNLSTLRWAPLSIASGPPPLYGSSMVWDPVLGRFLLFGGCSASLCSSTVWSFTPGGSAWSKLSPTGAVPSGRGSSAFAWDPVNNVSVLFGGFVPGPSGLTPLNGTYQLNTAASSWSIVPAGSEPPPEYGAAYAYSDYPGCVGLWIQGGNGATQGVVYNVYLLSPVPEPPPNCFTPTGGVNQPPSPCSNASAHLTVIVRDSLTGVGLPGSAVTVSGSCGSSAGTTGPGGLLNVTEAAPDVLKVAAAHVGYHPGVANITYTGRSGSSVVVSLAPLPSLHVRVLGRNLTGVHVLAGASVALNNVVILGATTNAGWVNASGIQVRGGSGVVSASAPSYSVAKLAVAIPYTGVAEAQLTLDAYGLVAIEFRDVKTGLTIPFSQGVLSFVDPVGRNTTPVTADAHGWFNESLAAGNYTITGGASGYSTNQTGVRFVHGWINTTIVPVNLTRLYGADVSVHLVSRSSGLGIPNGTVWFGASVSLRSDQYGWANATNVEPPGLTVIRASAPGFYPNQTLVTLGPYVVLPDVVIPMDPAPPCSAFSPCPPVRAAPTTGVFSLLPPAGPVRTLVLLVPVVVVVAGILVAWSSRLRLSSGTRAPTEPEVPFSSRGGL